MKNLSSISKKIFQNSYSLRKLNKKLILVVLLVLYISAQSLSNVKAAGTAQLLLGPENGSFEIGNTLKVTISSTSTDAVNAAQAKLVYDSSKIEFQSVDKNVTGFDVGCITSGGGGNVSVACAHSSAFTGTKVVADVYFKVLVGSGSTAITFASNSAIVRPSDAKNVWNGNSAGGTYTLTSPAPTPDPSPTPTPTPTRKSNSTPTTPPASSAKPSTPAPETNDSSAPVSDAPEAQGYLVAIKILDDDGKLIAGKTVYLDGKSAVSNDKGIASFVNVKPGSYKITDGKGKVLGDVTVSDAPSDPYVVQQFEVKTPTKNKYLVYVIPAGIFIGAIILLVVSRSGFEKIRAKRREFKKHFPNQPNNSSNTPPPPSPAETTTQSLQPEQKITPTNTGQTVLPNTTGEGGSKKPIVWSGDSDK